MQKNKHIHLIGICGTAMASLAGMLQQQGHRVTGSDAAAYPPMSDLLAGLGIPFCSMAAILHDEFLPGRESLVVAGTHGKTTTTSMLAWIYEVASRSN